ncbi:MAG: biotin/lipoyl-binding protein [Prevotella sp.]|nr:biotin/lipoyl-binding protein [Prevotella sp.]
MKKEYKYTINGKKYEVAIGDITDTLATIIVNGEEYQVEMEPESVEEKKVVVRKPVASEPIQNSGSSENNSARINTNNAIKAPLPGVITSIEVNVGDEVKEGDTILVLEAMKMANNIEAEKDGKVTAICVTPGQSVMEDDVLVVIE